jgi:ribosomal-protein-alanine N-acetyltransferase
LLIIGNIAKNLTDKFPFPYTEENGKSFIEFATKDDPIHIFAIDIDGQSVGGIGIHPQDDIHKRNAELGYWLAEPYWGLGITSSAIKEMVNFAFETYDIDRVFARPFGSKYCFTESFRKKMGSFSKENLKKY